MGCSDGYSAIEISKIVNHLDVIDGSKKMIEMLNQYVNKERINNISFFYGLFEEMNLDKCYDAISCSYVLEHVIDPIEILKVAKKHLKDDGYLLVTVPNAKALSRQMALEMGLINDLYALTENDLAHGHRRVYDMDSLERDMKAAGFSVVKKGGTFLKQFADFQLDLMMKYKIIGEKQITGMRKMAEIYPELSGSIYMILEKDSSK